MFVAVTPVAPLAQPLRPAGRPACSTAMGSPARDALSLSTACMGRPLAATQLLLPVLRTPALQAAVGAWLDGVGGRRSGPRPSIVAAVEATTDLADLVALRRFFRQADGAAAAHQGGTGWSPAFGVVGEALDRRIHALVN